VGAVCRPEGALVGKYPGHRCFRSLGEVRLQNSVLFGTKLPGPGCIYISQTLNFKAPVHIGAEMITTAKITELIPEKRRAIFHCVCKVGDKTVLEGEAVLMVPSRAPKK
jgi:3-hydroxybutyryl-CoA dehydratase